MKETVFISGVDRGLGLELAKQFLEAGFYVFGGKYTEELCELEVMNPTLRDHLYILPLDVSDERSVNGAFETVELLTDHLDIVINNAAILGDIKGTILDALNFDEIRQVLDVNTIGPLRLTNALMPLWMKGQRKLLVNISSEAGSIEDCQRNAWFGYCMSKAALNMQSVLISNELQKYGGQVFSIHPGHLRTYMQGKLDESATTEAITSAQKIVALLLQTQPGQYKEAQYIDYLGNQLPW